MHAPFQPTKLHIRSRPTSLQTLNRSVRLTRDATVVHADQLVDNAYRLVDDQLVDWSVFFCSALGRPFSLSKLCSKHTTTPTPDIAAPMTAMPFRFHFMLVSTDGTPDERLRMSHPLNLPMKAPDEPPTESCDPALRRRPIVSSRRLCPVLDRSPALRHRHQRAAQICS